MAIYEFASDHIQPMIETTFEAAGISERSDLQRLLRDQIEIISPDTLVIAEEYGEWKDSRRRIDLLGVDRGANLAVFELKRTGDGGHMDLQAIRYAAMVSTMTFEDAVDAYGRFLRSNGRDEDPRAAILEFLRWDEPDDDQFARVVRIVLASADFSRELTTSVLWLNERDLDIRCVRIKPYNDNGRTLVDVQQIVPLPEAADYQVRVKQKEQVIRKGRAEAHNLHELHEEFWEGLLSLAKQKTPRHADISPSKQGYIGASAGTRGLDFIYVINQNNARVELFIDRGPTSKEVNKRLFDDLNISQREIEQDFGGPLSWQRLDKKQGCRICQELTDGGIKSDKANWPAIQAKMVDAMLRLEKALMPHVAKLKSGP